MISCLGSECLCEITDISCAGGIFFKRDIKLLFIKLEKKGMIYNGALSKIKPHRFRKILR